MTDNHLIRVLCLMFCTILLSQCGEGGLNPCTGPGCVVPPPGPAPTLVKPPRLVIHSNCQELSATLKQELLDEVDANLESYSSCQMNFVGLPGSWGPASPTAQPTSADAGSTGSDNSTAGAEFTSTNLQEKGVDEADRIKTDGEYVYVAIPGGIDIFKAWPMPEFAKLATYAVDSNYYAQLPSIYLWGEKLVLVSQASASTKITILDVSDPAHPVKLDEREMTGSYLASRLTDSVLHLVVSGLFLMPAESKADLSGTYANLHNDRQKICGQQQDGTPEALVLAVEKARQEAAQLIETKLSSASWRPSYKNLNGQTVLAGCGEIFIDPSSHLSHMTGFLSVDLNALDKPQVSFVNGYSYTVYASPKSVYLAASTGTQTNVHRFAIGSEEKLHQYTGTGGVLGRVLNSFSMGEKDNAFRIATSVGWNGHSNVSLLDNSKPELDVLGSIENMAPGESIYAVRFVGDKGYVVTFKQIDPLFVLDLSKPEAPSILGELKMPGYSTYLHPLDENRLLGLGKDVDDQGSFGWFQGLKLALFDVSDATNPLVADEEIIGTRGTESEALADHHAFTFDAESGTLALPLTYCAPSGTGRSPSGGRFEYQGVHLYSVSETAIESAGVIKLPAGASAPLRTVLMGDEDARAVYILDEDKLYLANTADPSRIQEEIGLTRAVPGNSFWGSSSCGGWMIWD